MRPALSRASIAIAALLTTSAALAHHSFAMFDQSRTVTLEGTVKEFRWTNPHSFIEMLVKNESGAEEQWSIEMTSPEHLARDLTEPWQMTRTYRRETHIDRMVHEDCEGEERNPIVDGKFTLAPPP